VQTENEEKAMPLDPEWLYLMWTARYPDTIQHMEDKTDGIRVWSGRPESGQAKRQ